MGSSLSCRSPTFLSHHSYSLGLSPPRYQLSVCQNHLEDLFNCRLPGSSPELSNHLRVCIFHQFPGDAAAAGLETHFENCCSIPVSAQSRKMATKRLHLQVTALATRRDSPCLLLTSWDTGLTGPVEVPSLPQALSYGQKCG